MQFCKGPINLHFGDAPPWMHRAAALMFCYGMVSLPLALLLPCNSNWGANVQEGTGGGVPLTTAE